MVDGTLIPLFAKPGHYGEQFFDHKSNYSLSLTVCSPTFCPYTDTDMQQLVTLPNMHVINYVLGPPGSTHDSMSFKESHAWKESGHLFQDGEWLWADSAYPLTPWCIVPYKHPQSLVLANHQFNYHLSKVCLALVSTFTPLTFKY